MVERKTANDINSVWPGLNHYNESDSALFFGREAEANLIRETIARQQICIVFGPSGIGKTSLVLAGVFPKMRATGDWLPVRIRLDHSQGADSYAKQIKMAVLKAIDDAKSHHDFCAALEDAREETLWEWFHRNRVFNAFGVRQQIVVFIDQFEEIFQTKAAGDSHREWFASLSDFAENTVPESVARKIAKSGDKLAFNIDEQPWRVVLSIREDFLPRLEEIADVFPIFKRNRISIAALSRSQALMAVERPGENILAPNVAEAIVDIVQSDQRTDPTILSLICRELDIRRQKDGRETIDESMLQMYGGQILPRFYDENMSAVSPKTRDVLEEQLTTSDGFRAKLSITDAVEAGVTKEEYERLEKYRILHIEHGGKTVWLEFSHDKLAELAKDSRVKRKEREAAEKLRRENEEQIKRQKEKAEQLELENARQKRKTRFWCRVAMFLGASLFAILGFAKWYWLKDYDTYYRDFTKIRGVPHGIGKLLPNEVAGRRCIFHFKFHAPGWFKKRSYALPYLVEAIGGTRGDDGEFIRTTFHTKTAFFGDADIMLANNEGIHPATVILGLGNEKIETQGNVNEQGNDKTYYGKDIRLMYDCQRVCAWKYTYSPPQKSGKGFPVSETGIDKNGNDIWVLQYGTSLVSGSNMVLPAHFVSPNGKPLIHESDMYIDMTYKESSDDVSEIAIWQFGKTGGPKKSVCDFSNSNHRVHAVYGWSGWREPVYRNFAEMEYSNKGLLSEEILSPSETNKFKRIRNYSPDSDNLERVVCTTNMNSALDIGNADYAESVTENIAFRQLDIKDLDDDMLEKRFEVDLRTFQHPPKRAIIVETWTNGIPMPVSVSLRNADNTQATNKFGITFIENGFDSSGNLCQQDFYAPENRLDAFGLNGIHHVKYLYDTEMCSVTNVKYFACGEKPASGPLGVHEVRMNLKQPHSEYSHYVILMSQRYYDENGDPATSRFGSTGYELKGFKNASDSEDAVIESLYQTLAKRKAMQEDTRPPANDAPNKDLRHNSGGNDILSALDALSQINGQPNGQSSMTDNEIVEKMERTMNEQPLQNQTGGLFKSELATGPKPFDFSSESMDECVFLDAEFGITPSNSGEFDPKRSSRRRPKLWDMQAIW